VNHPQKKLLKVYQNLIKILIVKKLKSFKIFLL
jgi:hypothetical protein